MSDKLMPLVIYVMPINSAICRAELDVYGVNIVLRGLIEVTEKSLRDCFKKILRVLESESVERTLKHGTPYYSFKFYDELESFPVLVTISYVYGKQVDVYKRLYAYAMRKFSLDYYKAD